MENTKANTVLDYCNDVFFKYTLSREDEGSVYARNTIIERVTGIRVKESTVLNPNLDPGIIGKKRIILDVQAIQIFQGFSPEIWGSTLGERKNKG